MLPRTTRNHEDVPDAPVSAMMRRIDGMLDKHRAKVFGGQSEFVPTDLSKLQDSRPEKKQGKRIPHEKLEACYQYALDKNVTIYRAEKDNGIPVSSCWQWAKKRGLETKIGERKNRRV